MYIAFAGLATNIILSYFLIHKYALVGAAVATSITSFVAMVLVLAYSYNFFGYLFKFSSFVKILLASTIMYFASTFFPEGKYIFLLWSTILFAIYIFLLYIFREFGASDLEILKQLLAKKKLKTAVDVEEEVL
jgi:stage V sporulation protein B